MTACYEKSLFAVPVTEEGLCAQDINPSAAAELKTHISSGDSCLLSLYGELSVRNLHKKNAP